MLMIQNTKDIKREYGTVVADFSLLICLNELKMFALIFQKNLDRPQESF